MATPPDSSSGSTDVNVARDRFRASWLAKKAANAGRAAPAVGDVSANPVGRAAGRVAAREQVGKLIGGVIDHGPSRDGRAGSLRATVPRILSTAGLTARWSPRPEEEMGGSGAALHEYLMETRGGFVSWERFTGLFCRPADPA